MKRDGPIRGQPGEDAVFRREVGVIDLIAPGVHGADHQTVRKGHIPGHGRQGGDPNGGFVHGKGKALGGGNADADARKGAGADSHGNGVHVGQLQVRIFQDVLHNGHQCAAVGQTGILVAGG